MASDLQSLATVSATVAAAMSYARLASSLRPGLPRLAALLPVLVLLPVLPFSFSLIHLRGISAFFLAWLGVFKLLLVASGRGPLDPSLPHLRFIATASLPVKFRTSDPAGARRRYAPTLFLSSAVKAAVLAGLASLYRFKDTMDSYLLLTIYSCHLYLALELVLASAAAVAKALLGMDLEPQFNKPYLSASLRDFWGRRWNLMVSAILRPSVYHPVRSRFGASAAVVATFVVSGLMHEVMFYYITLRPPTGEVMAFFVLHGVCTAGEGWLARQDWVRRPPRAAATPLTLAFVGGTAFWLFFPQITRSGADQKMLAECEAVVAFLREAPAKLIGSARLVWTSHVTEPGNNFSEYL